MSQFQAAASQLPRDTLDGLGDRLDRAVADAAAKIRDLQAAATEQARRADALERQLAIAEAKLAVEMMHSAGLAAQASHMMAIAIEADVPALTELAEETEIDGRLTSRLGQVYEAAFDAKAGELGIEDPARFREA